MKKRKTVTSADQVQSSARMGWRCSRRALIAAMGAQTLAAAAGLSPASAAVPEAKSDQVVSHASRAPVVRFLGRAAVPDKAVLFPLHAVRLLDGPVRDGQEMNRRYLLTLEPDRLLSWFRRGAGLDPKAPPYRGWESEAPLLPGHILGFYLSGASMMLQATGDVGLRERLNYIVEELARVQAANGSGYMLAVPDGKEVFAQIAGGQIEIGGLPWTGYEINGHFEPTYTLNKLMLGLYQALLATGNPQAQQVLTRLADWFGESVLDHLTEDQTQTLLDCEHGSLHESFAEVYALTGDAKYLTWARRLCHERMLAPLAAGDGDFLTNYHANTQIPKFTGFEYIYGFTGEPKLDAAAVNFWNDVVERRTWVIGGNSAAEHFFAPTDFARALQEPAGPESCNTVNMLRLTEAVYRQRPSAHLMDYYERALFNHLLAVHDPERGMFVYYTALRPGAYRVYSDPYDSMWCCVGTGLEAPGKYGQMIYTRAPDNGALDVNLFIASELTWTERGVVVRQETSFPDEPGTRLMLTCPPAGAAFTLRVRHPAWVPDGQMALSVNGKALASASRRGEYAEVHRQWRSGDVVAVSLPMTTTVEALLGDDSYVALLHGPIVLAGALGREGLKKEDFWQIGDTVARRAIPESSVPAFVSETAGDTATRLQPVPDQPLTFRATGLALTDGSPPSNIELVPFFRCHFQRYTVYWRRFTAAGLQAEQAHLADEAHAQQALDARTLDRVQIGDDASEAVHHLQGRNTNTGPGAYGEFMDSHWRDAGDGGWFSYAVAVPPDQLAILRCTFWGREQGARAFDILVNGKTLASPSLADTGKDGFISLDLPLSAAVTQGQTMLTVTFQARPGNTAGGLFDLRVLRPNGNLPAVPEVDGQKVDVNSL